jgi:general secretion pathway protein A
MLNTSEIQKDLRFSRQGMANPPLTNMTSAQRPLDNALLRGRDDERSPEDTKLHLTGRLRPELLFERWGIVENPFGVTPNPRYLYESKTHGEARSSLIAGIECGVGFQGLIAPPGMGKTTILLSVLERFKDVARTAFLFQIQGDSRDFLRYLLLDLDCDAHDLDLVRMQDALNQLLIREHRAGRYTIIVIDEAQSLDVSVLETVRLLSNFETPSEKLVQIILAGQPALAQRLAAAGVAQLYQRICIRTTLIPFTLEDTRNYIEHRLRIAGYEGPRLFTPEAVRLIWERSQGIPRDINTLCFNALLLARAVEQKQVDSDTLREVMADLDLNPIRFTTDQPVSGTLDLQSANPLRRGDAAADPPATSIGKVCEAVVLAARPESDEVAIRAARSDPPALACHPKDEVTSAGPGVAGFPSCEAEVPHLTPPLDASKSNGTATRVHLKPFLLTNSVWIAAIVALVTAGALLVHHYYTGAQNVGSPIRMAQQDRRTVNSTMDRIPTESSAHKTAVNKKPAPGPAVENSSEKLSNIGEILNNGDKATLVSDLVSNLGSAGTANQTGLIANIVSARLIHQVKPIYPNAALEAGIQGSVVLQVLVDKDGAVRDVRLISGSPALAPAAIDAVKRWQYRPSYVNGQPLEWEWLVTVRFKLR